jgi:serine/threonine-protein kinase
MATVYKARDMTDKNRPAVALKVLDEAHLGDPDLVNKFLREGMILQQLAAADPDAPLVHVHHHGRAGGDSGRPFIAMELLDGEDLLRHLRRLGRLQARAAVHFVSGVARALIPAHAAGIYHRDLTPDNVILVATPKGGYRLRLIDFGVARHEYTSHGTLDGSIAGKPPYMSPEQCRGLPVDGRSDIYSLGILLFALAVGAPPFVDNNPLEVMRRHQEDPVRYPDNFPSSLRLILDRALAKDRDHRYQTVAEMFNALKQLEKIV